MTVNSLEWTVAALWSSYGLIIRIAQTPFGAYKILKGSQDRFEVYFGNVPFSGSMETDEEAMQWAQSDFAARIKSTQSVTVIDEMGNGDALALFDIPEEPHVAFAAGWNACRKEITK